MKKTIIYLMLILMLAFSLAGCGQSADNSDQSSEPEVAEEPSTSGDGGALVVYFSSTGTTENVANHIATITGADLYEIQAADPYTTEDLNYSNSSSRSTQEQNDSSARPAIAGTLPDVSSYETIYLGYPIWWGEAPRIVNTFLEGVDLSGKTVVTFCTSGSTQISGSHSALEAAVPGATWIMGQRFGSGASESEVSQWLEGLGL